MGNSSFLKLLYEAVGAVRSESLAILDSVKGEEDLMNLFISSLGLDSVEIYELIGYMEDNSGITIPESKIFSFKTLGDLRDFIGVV